MLKKKIVTPSSSENPSHISPINSPPKPPKQKTDKKRARKRHLDSQPQRELKTISESPTKQKNKTEELPKKSNRPTFSLSLGKRSSSPEKHSRQSPKGSQSKSSKTSPRNISSRENYCMIQAVFKGDIKEIQKFLNDSANNPNQQTIGPLNTLLHLAVLNHNQKMAMLLLTNSRVNSLTKNKDGKAPFQLIIEKDIVLYHNLHKALILRANLDQIVNAMILTDPAIIENDDTLVMQKLSEIKLRIAHVIPDYATIQFMLAMIRSRTTYDIATLKMIIAEQKKNPNAQDVWGNTLLHYVVYLRHKRLLFILLKNPEINSLIKNSENLSAHQLFPATDKYHSELRPFLFARNSLDCWIEKQIPYLFLINPKTDLCTLSCTDEAFKETVIAIKKESSEIANQQKSDSKGYSDRELPQETIYPDYATDQFLLEAFRARMKQNKPVNHNDSLFQEFEEIIPEKNEPSVTELLHSHIQDNTPVKENNITYFTRLKKSDESRKSLLSDITQIDSDSTIDPQILNDIIKSMEPTKDSLT